MLIVRNSPANWTWWSWHRFLYAVHELHGSRH
jgi:hypothetical protein